MAARTGNPTRRHRRAIVAASTVVLLALGLGGVVALARVAQTTSVRAALQWEADQAALASAAALARPSAAALPRLSETELAVTLGRWDTVRRRFVAGGLRPNAAEAIVRGSCPGGEHGSRWFSKVLPPPPSAASTLAVAAVRPRDIVFVVDLSSAMAAGSLAAADRLLEAEEGRNLSKDVAALAQLYRDLGYPSFPGPSEPLGAPWGLEPGVAWDALTAPDGPLSYAGIPAEDRITPGDPVSIRRLKACSAVIGSQILRLMPEAMPDPQRPENRAYWAAYLDEVSSRGAEARIGYASYVAFMLRHGRNEQTQGHYVPLSRHSDHCPWHLEQVAGVSLRFPPRVEPIHRVRRALAGAISRLEQRNCGIDDRAQRDRVAIVSFDWPPGGARVQQPLTSDYASAIRVCARLQAAGYGGPASRPESGLELAGQLLHGASAGVYAGRNAEQIVVLLTASSPDSAPAGRCWKKDLAPDRIVHVSQGDAEIRAALNRIVNTTTVALVR